MNFGIDKLTLYRPVPGDLLYDLPAGQPLPERVSELVSLSQKLRLSGNLWQNYLTYYLINHENPFTMSREQAEDRPDGLRLLALRDMAVFHRLFHWNGSGTGSVGAVEPGSLSSCDSPSESSLFSILLDFSLCSLETESGKETELKYTGGEAGSECLNSEYSECVKPEYSERGKADRKEAAKKNSPRTPLAELVRALAEAQNAEAFLSALTGWYRHHGVGDFGLYRSFRVVDGADGLRLRPLKTGTQTLGDLVGYEIQKNRLRQNTAALLSGKPAANVLLYGDAGTGKSSAVRALLNEWPGSSLRLVEMTKAQISSLGAISTLCGQRNYKFILFIDDLSFEEQEVEYKQLKAAMEGSAEERPDNLRIYATSNRRHLLRENWSDRSDMEHDGDVHRSDTLEEKLSLAGRFGLAISYSSPNPALYRQIVLTLAREAGIAMEEKELLRLADTFSIRKGGMTGRAAQQFVDSLLCE